MNQQANNSKGSTNKPRDDIIPKKSQKTSPPQTFGSFQIVGNTKSLVNSSSRRQTSPQNTRPSRTPPSLPPRSTSSASNSSGKPIIAVSISPSTTPSTRYRENEPPPQTATTTTKGKSGRSLGSPLTLQNIDLSQLSPIERTGIIPNIRPQHHEYIEHLKGQDHTPSSSSNHHQATHHNHLNREDMTLRASLLEKFNRKRLGLTHENDKDYVDVESLDSDYNSSSLYTESYVGRHTPHQLETSEFTNRLVDAIDELNKDTLLSSRRTVVIPGPDIVTRSLNTLIMTDSMLLDEGGFSELEKQQQQPTKEASLRLLNSRKKAQRTLLKFINEKEAEERHRLQREKLQNDLDAGRLSLMRWRENKDAQNQSIKNKVLKAREFLKSQKEQEEQVNEMMATQRVNVNREVKNKTKQAVDASNSFLCLNNMMSRQFKRKDIQRKEEKVRQKAQEEVMVKKQKAQDAKLQIEAVSFYETDEQVHQNKKRKEKIQKMLSDTKQQEIDTVQAKVLKVKLDKYSGLIEKQQREQVERERREMEHAVRRQQRALRRNRHQNQTSNQTLPVQSTNSMIHMVEEEEIRSHSQMTHYSDRSKMESFTRPASITPTVIPRLHDIRLNLSALSKQENSKSSMDLKSTDRSNNSLSSRMTNGLFSPGDHIMVTDTPSQKTPPSPVTNYFQTIKI